MINFFNQKIKKYFYLFYKKLFILIFYLYPVFAFAEEDPMSRAGKKFYTILFGGLGVTVCSLIIGATFIMAQSGRITWDKFLYIGFCTAGFIGTPSIITLLQSAVGR